MQALQKWQYNVFEFNFHSVQPVFRKYDLSIFSLTRLVFKLLTGNNAQDNLTIFKPLIKILPLNKPPRWSKFPQKWEKLAWLFPFGNSIAINRTQIPVEIEN